MAKAEDDPLRLLNQSGYLLQLAIVDLVTRARGEHGWQVLSQEHPWKRGDEAGYADLILGKESVRLIVECKRFKQATWMFLAEATAKDTERLRCHWIGSEDGRNERVGWFDTRLEPGGVESGFCVVRGTDEERAGFLERLLAPLLQSVLPLASEDRQVSCHPGQPQLFHVPMIVTTARIAVARYDPAAVDLATGTVQEVTLEHPGFVRFRKSLSHDLTNTTGKLTLAARASDKERSVLIVEAPHFLDLLKRLRLYPGDALRELGRNQGWLVGA